MTRFHPIGNIVVWRLTLHEIQLNLYVKINYQIIHMQSLFFQWDGSNRKSNFKVLTWSHNVLLFFSVFFLNSPSIVMITWVTCNMFCDPGSTVLSQCCFFLTKINLWLMVYHGCIVFFCKYVWPHSISGILLCQYGL